MAGFRGQPTCSGKSLRYPCRHVVQDEVDFLVNVLVLQDYGQKSASQWTSTLPTLDPNERLGKRAATTHFLVEAGLYRPSKVSKHRMGDGEKQAAEH